MRLSQAALSARTSSLSPPSYDRKRAIGIVHFGIGAFHRAHQAWYTDACLRDDETGWMIAGVSLRSYSVADQLSPQDCLYTVTEQSAAGSETDIIGSVREVLVAKDQRSAIISHLASPDCHIASFTVTEKGYCRAPNGSLDFGLARHGFYPILAKGLAGRKRAGLGGLTLLSCDNLSGNGQQLRRLITEWLAGEEPALSNWFDAECTTPGTMVDRIVPAVREEDLASLEQNTGLFDKGAVFTEPFSQWIIENSFAGPRPAWEQHGAQIVADVTPYEEAKLRMLNGAHSLLAYIGLNTGHEFVHQAIADPRLRQLTEQLMLTEAAPTIEAGKGQDLQAYASALIERFANPALKHRLIQIAMDGSQKIPQRWLATLEDNQKIGRQCPAILTGLAHWIVHIRGEARPVEDPAADELASLAKETAHDLILDRLFGPGCILASQWQPSQKDRETVLSVLVKLLS